MSYSYKYETFRAPSREFDKQFTSYLNERANDHWRVKHCNYCYGSADSKKYASCMFERTSQ